MDRERKRKDKESRWKACPTPQGRGGGETPHMKGLGMLVGNFELNP